MSLEQKPAEPYREMHADRGGTYDEALTRSAFDAYMTDWESRHVLAILSRRCPGGIGRYLDFACGTGRMTQVIAPHASEVVGVDVSASMIDAARPKLPGARFVQADLTSESVDIGSFDLVSSFRFFGNAEMDLRVAVLRALNARVRDGGYLLVNNHRNPWAITSLIDRISGGTMEVDLTPRRFRGILDEAGFRIVEIHPIAVWQFRFGLAATAGSHPRREEKLERIFSSSAWATIAPDAVILAQKVRSLR